MPAGRLEQPLLVLVEDPLGRGSECLRLGEEATDELIGLRARPEGIERPVQVAARSERRLDVVEGVVRGDAEPLRVPLVERAHELHPQAVAAGGVVGRLGRASSTSAATWSGYTRSSTPSSRTARSSDGGCGRARTAAAITSASRSSPFSRATAGFVASRRLDARDELVDRALLDALLAEHRQHVRDVVHEHRVRPDDEDAAALELAAVGVEEPRRPVQADRRLAGAGAALDDEHALRLERDQAVLVGLDRRDDVAHVLVAAALELLEQDVGDAVDDVAGRAVQRLVVEVEQPAALVPEPAAERHALRVGDGRRVEGAGGGRLPVDDDRRLLLVHPAPPDVERPEDAVEVEPAEAEAALGVLERQQPLVRPGLEDERLDLADPGVAGALDLPPHLLEAGVGVVDVGLLGGELWVHGGLSRGRRRRRAAPVPAP